LQLQRGLSGDVTLKTVDISVALCIAGLSPCLMALPLPDVDMQLAIIKPVLNEKGLEKSTIGVFVSVSCGRFFREFPGSLLEVPGIVGIPKAVSCRWEFQGPN